MLGFRLTRLKQGAAEEAVPAPDISRIFPHLRESGRQPAPAPAAVHTELDDAAPQREVTPVSVAVWLERDIDRLKSDFALFTVRPDDAATCRALFLQAHNLKGMASAYGQPAIGRLCTSLCRLLEAGPEAQTPPALVKLHVDAVVAAARLPVGGAQSELAERVCVALEDHVHHRLGGG